METREEFCMCKKVNKSVYLFSTVMTGSFNHAILLLLCGLYFMYISVGMQIQVFNI